MLPDYQIGNNYYYFLDGSENSNEHIKALLTEKDSEIKILKELLEKNNIPLPKVEESTEQAKPQIPQIIGLGRYLTRHKCSKDSIPTLKKFFWDALIDTAINTKTFSPVNNSEITVTPNDTETIVTVVCLHDIFYNNRIFTIKLKACYTENPQNSILNRFYISLGDPISDKRNIIYYEDADRHIEFRRINEIDFKKALDLFCIDIPENIE